MRGDKIFSVQRLLKILNGHVTSLFPASFKLRSVGEH